MTMAAFFLLLLFLLCSSYSRFWFTLSEKKGISLENCSVALMMNFVFMCSQQN